MSGAVTIEQLQWLIGLMFAAGGAVAAFLFWVWRLVVGLQSQFASQIKERDTAAQLETERAKLVEGELRKELHAYQISAAEKFATKDGMTQAIGRMEQAIERLTNLINESVDRITSRVDRLLDNRNDTPPKR